ncbi:ATP-dependent helicase HrpB [Marinicellulosiphila megalodicopiae]|uniref:ATP-dependent helicase HrpB n=1 Tax=Marinicellulosiphila megalodicopiae TaxID=2724896 RepID=UPI003BB080F2
MITLPIHACKQDFQTALFEHSQVILQAPPGAGKTTTVPLWLLETLTAGKKIYLLQPRRLACLNSAKRLSQLVESEVGKKVGYRIRFENKTSNDTQIEVMTLGVFINILQSNPELLDADCVIFDEFHERSIENDIAFAMTLACKEYYNDELKIVIMSATLNTELLQKHLDWPLIKSEGKLFDIRKVYNPAVNFADQVDYILQRQQKSAGHILVFLAGKKEIRHFSNAIPSAFILHGQLNLEEQQKVFNLTQPKQIILSTNIAESSLTIDGVREVIDFGQERFLQINNKGQNTLLTRQISLASSQQRCGRSGRQGEGHYTSMWSKDQVLVAQSPSAITEQDFSLYYLRLKLWGLDLDDLVLLEKPKLSEINRCKSLLTQLKLIDDNQQFDQALAKRLVKYGCSLPVAMLLDLAGNNPNNATLLRLASFIEEQQSTQNNLDNDLRKFTSYVNQLNNHHPIKKQQQRWKQQLNSYKREDIHLDQALIHAMPSQIAFRQKHQFVNVQGQSFDSANINESIQWILILDSISFGNGHDGKNKISSWVSLSFTDIEPLLVEKLITSKDGLKGFTQKTLGKIIVSQQPAKLNKEQLTQALLENFKQNGIDILLSTDDQQSFFNRLQWAVNNHNAFTQFNKNELEQNLSWLLPYLENKKSISQINLKEALTSLIGFSLMQTFDQLFPLKWRIPSGDNVSLIYKKDHIILGAKVQGLFGLKQTPSICNNKIPLLIQLLSPAGKPVQTTQDLVSFWQAGYFEVKKEMKGRYPKHPWPDDPANAVATLMTKKRFEANQKK